MGVVVEMGQMWRGRIPRSEHGVLCRFAVRLAGARAVSYATDLPAAVGVVVEGYEHLPVGERRQALRAAAAELGRTVEEQVAEVEVRLDARAASGRLVLRTDSEWAFLTSLAEAGLLEISMRI